MNGLFKALTIIFLIPIVLLIIFVSEILYAIFKKEIFRKSSNGVMWSFNGLLKGAHDGKKKYYKKNKWRR